MSVTGERVHGGASSRGPALQRTWFCSNPLCVPVEDKAPPLLPPALYGQNWQENKENEESDIDRTLTFTLAAPPRSEALAQVAQKCLHTPWALRLLCLSPWAGSPSSLG